MNTKLHAVTDAKSRAIQFFLSAGQVSDDTGAAALGGQSAAGRLVSGGPSYGADLLRKAFQDRGIQACSPGRKSRRKTVTYDKRRCKRRNRLAIMFGRLKDSRRVAIQYDRCPETNLSAIALAAKVFWL